MLNWKPIIKTATKAAEDLGHKLGRFGRTRQGIGHARRIASCGTPEAAGLKRAAETLL